MSNGVVHDDAYYIQLGKDAELAKAQQATAATELATAPANPAFSQGVPAAPAVAEPKPFQFGPMPASTAPSPTQPAVPAPLASQPGTAQETKNQQIALAQQSSLTDADIERILKAMGVTPSTDAALAAQLAKPVPPEDQRVLDALSRVYPTGRDAVVAARYPVGTNLSVVEVAYTPSTGARRATEALIFDDGKKTFVFGAI